MKNTVSVKVLKSVHLIKLCVTKLQAGEKDGKINLVILVTMVGTTLTLATIFAILLTTETFNLKHYYETFNRTNSSLTDRVESFQAQENEKVVSCYYNTPAVQEEHQLLPSSINPHLCTHINVAFAQVKDKKIYMDTSQWQTIREIIKLKKVNPKLKVLLSVGGAGNDAGFAVMVVNHASRKEFIKSIKYVLKNHSLDGIDLDWEFPGIKEYHTSLSKRQRQHFSQLLREIRMEYLREKRDYLLTVAVAAPKIIVDVAYDVDQINLYVDYVNLMSYDFHYFSQFTPFTGLNSPLYARPSEHLYMGTLNINYTVQMYLDKGLNESKIVLGIPTYGHSFTLGNANNAKIGSPALGFGSLGSLGFINYPEICLFMSKFKSNITFKSDQDAKVPYLYKNTEWVSYDDPQSVTAKADFIKAHNLRGAMIYSLNADDYEGVCTELVGSGKFPLTLSIKNALHQN